MKKLTFFFLAAVLLLAVPVQAARPAYTGWKAEVEKKLSTGDFAGAMTQLKSVEAADQQDEDYYFLMGKASSAMGNLDEAMKNLDKAISLDAKFTEAMGHKSVVFLRMGKTAEAEALSTQAIGIEPSGELYYARGAIRMTQARFEEAIADLDAAIGLDPKNDEYYVARGEVRLRVGRTSEAEKDYARAMELNSKNAKAYLGRGGLMLVKGDLSAARMDLDRCVELAPNFSSCYLRRGKMRQMKGELEDSLRDYVKSTDLAPDSTEAWFERAMSELENSKFEDAEGSARKIIQLENTGRGEKVLGMVLTARGKYDEAVAAFSTVLKNHAEDYETWYLRGNAYALNKDFDKALPDLDKAISVEKRYLDSYLTKAQILITKKEPEKALEVYNAAIAIAPKTAMLYQYRSDLYEQMGQYDKSFADFKKAKELAAEAREGK